MSHDQIGKTTRRDFLGTATAATALTLGTSPGAEAQTAPVKSDEVQVAQLTTGQNVQPTATGAPDWTKPRPWRSPRRDTSSLSKAATVQSFQELLPTMASRSLQRSSPDRENAIREYGKTIEEAVKGDPTVLAPLRLHYLRWVLVRCRLWFALHVSGHLRYRLRQISRGCRCALHEDRDHDGVCKSGRMARGLEDKPASRDQILSR